MESLIIALLALVSLALTGALLAAVVRRPKHEQTDMKDILETLMDPRVAAMRSHMDKVSN